MANWTGLPDWFIGGIVGLALVLIVLPILIQKLKFTGIILSLTGLFLVAVNYLVFYWPMWASVTAAAAVFYEAMR